MTLAAGAFPLSLAAFAAAQPAPAPDPKLPSASEVGMGLALENHCYDRDGFTLCDPSQEAVGATFRQLLCVEYGSDLEHHTIARCVYKGARLEYRVLRHRRFSDFRDGAIDLIHIGNSWLPEEH
jgi:hypothetical protein